MDFVTHLPRTSLKHDAVWVIVDRLTKSTHFLVVRMTFTLEEFCKLYIQEIIRLHGVPIYIVPGSQVYCSLLEEFPESHGNIVDDEHCFSSTDRQPVRDDHSGFRGHAAGMRLISQGWLGRAFSLGRVRL